MDGLNHFMNSDLNAGILIFIAFISLFVALFHNLLFSEIFDTEKNFKILFAIYPGAIISLGLLVKPTYGLLLFGVLFISTFLLAIFAMIIGMFRSGVAKAEAKNPKVSTLTKILGGVGSILIYLTFFVSPLFLFLLLLVVIPFFNSLKQSNKKTFYRSQHSLPTSKIRSLSMGLAEISGKAEKIELMTAPLKSKKCIGYHYTIEDISTDDEGRNSYSTVFSETKCNSFYLDDGTGKIFVMDELPEFIDFDIDERYSTNQRFTQYLLTDELQVLFVGAAKPGQNGAAVFGRDEVRNVFGVSPQKNVDFYNSLRPLRQAAVVFAYILAVLVATILVTPIKLSNGKIIFEKIKLWNSSNSDIPRNEIHIYE